MQQLVCESSTQQQAPAGETSVTTTSASPAPFAVIKSSLSFVESPWCELSGTDQQTNQIKLCRIGSQPSVSTQPLLVTHTIVINDDCTWKLTVYGHEISPTCGVLSSIPQHLTACKLQEMVKVLAEINICPGNHDASFIELARSRKGKFFTASGELKAELQPNIQSCGLPETIRVADCDFVVKDGTCSKCSGYRSQLRMMLSRYKHKCEVPHKFSNERYMNTPQKRTKIKSLRERATAAEANLQKLRNRMKILTDSDGVQVSKDFHDDIFSVMCQKNDDISEQFPQGSFRRLFWEEQFKAAKVADPRQMRWHPTMIQWCLNLKLLSSACYHSLRTSGFIKLPSERSLRDYTHFFKSKPGFQDEVDLMLMREANLSKLPDWRKYIVILFDEIKVRANLVYDKYSGDVIGFVQLGEVNDALNAMEKDFSDELQYLPKVATHVLGVMVRGLFTSLLCTFPYCWCYW